ncbi:MAG: STAS/SEC14 domain-containing protein [Patescibacteria group bacterium]|jgi:hypothetical protein
MATEEEIKNTFKITADADEILNFAITGNVNDVAANVRQAELVDAYFQKIFNDNQERKFKCLVDLSPIKATAHYPSPQARQIYAKILNYQQLQKIAIVVPSLLTQAIINFILHAAIKRGGIKLFKSKTKAIEWLKQA